MSQGSSPDTPNGRSEVSPSQGPESPTQLVHHALHGYREGHRRLASSVKLTPDEAMLLDQLSDLTGFVPPDYEVPPYESGYLCGRFYAFARTWPDPTVPRDGAVLTHTLLLPLGELDNIDDLFAFASGFKRPESREELDFYSRQVDVPLAPDREPDLSEEARRDILLRFFSDLPLPLLVRTPNATREVVRLLWQVTKGSLRQQVSFFTVALKPVHRQGRPIAVQGVPAPAWSAFSKLSGHPTVWPPNGERALTPEDWLEIDCVDLAELAQVFAHALEDNLEVASRRGFSLAWRLHTLSQRSSRDRSAAKGVLDLLETIGQQAPARRWREALDTYLEHVFQEPVPFPVRHLLDLCSRKRVLELAGDSALAAFFQQEVARALFSNTEPGAPWGDLIARVKDSPLEDPFYATLHDVVADRGLDVLTQLPIDVAVAAIARRPEGYAEWLGSLSPEDRLDLAGRWLEAATHERAQVASVIRDAAMLCRDVSLLHVVHGADNLQGFLDDVLRLSLARGPFDTGVFQDARKLVSKKALVSWSVRQAFVQKPGEELAALVASTVGVGEDAGSALLDVLAGVGPFEEGRGDHGESADDAAEWAGAPSVAEDEPRSPDGLSRVSRGSLQAARTWCAYIARGPAWPWPDLVVKRGFHLVVFNLAVQFPDTPGLPETLKGLLPLTDVAWFLSPPGFQLLNAAEGSAWERALQQRVTPEVLMAALQGQADQPVYQWLAHPSSRSWIRDASLYDLLGRRKLPEIEGLSLATVLEFILSDAGAVFADRGTGPREVVTTTYHRSSLEDIEAAAPMWAAAISTRRGSRNLQEGLVFLAFEAAKHYPQAALAEVVAAAFMPMHRALCDKRSPPLFRVVLGWIGFAKGDWDKAKALREWALRAWWERKWPPLLLLQAIHEDEQVITWMVEHARKHGQLALFHAMLAEEGGVPDQLRRALAIVRACLNR